MKRSPLVLIFLLANFALGQVKIGDNINTIDQASLVELESDSKVFVVTRVSAVQMNSITPLNGALVYNTDDNCLFQYRSNSWVSLCVDIMGGQTVTTITDNNDGTFSYNNEAGSTISITKASLNDNNDGTYTFDNGNLPAIILDTNANSNPYDNTVSSLAASTVQEALDELNSALNTSNTADLDTDATNELSDLAITGTTITLTNAEAGATGVDLGTTFATDAEVATAIADSEVLDLDKDDTNELSDVTLAGTTLSLTNAVSGATGVDLDTTFATDAELAAAADDDITSATLSAASLLTINEGTSFVDVSLADLEESADITANATAIQNVQDEVDQNELDADAAIQNLQNDVDQNELDADAAIQNVQNDVDQNEIDADVAIQNVQNDVNQNEFDADAAIALKEDAANKSTDVTLADATNTLFPTELAVKTYVDGQIAATADDDITSATLSSASLLTINEGTSFVDVSLADLEESADITANATTIQNVQDDVDQNELDADAAIQNLQDDVDQNELDADAAIQNLQDDVDQNELDADAAIALKEDAANKSTDVALGTSDVAFPTQNAVKTYVDGQITATADDDITSATLSAASLLTINEGTSFVDVSLADLEESADITANATAIQNLQDDVDQNELDADAAIQNLQNDVDQNEIDADAAIALKEDAANKSTDITLADATNTLFPTELAVKTYVDGQITATADDDITSATLSAASLLTINEGTSFVDVSLADLEESADITAEETRALAAEALKEDTANKSTDITLADATNTLFPTELAVKTYVDALAISDVIAGNKIATITQSDGTTITDIDETITSFESPVGLANTLRYNDETGASTDITDITRSVNGVNPSANGNVAVLLSNVSTGLEADRPASGVDADIYIVSGQVAPSADRNGVAFIYDDVTGWQEVTTDLSTSDARYLNVIGDSMVGILGMGGNVISNLSDPGNPQDAATKNYVDAQITATSDDDITAVSFDGTNLTVNEGVTTSFSANLSALEESVDITANTTAITAEETRALAAEALKEDTANKSTDVALGTSDVAFPTQNAVKTYVDGQITATADDDISSATLSAASLLTINEGTSFVDVSLADLEESADITANATAIQNVQDDVDQNELDADAAIQNLQNDVDQNELDADAAIALKEDAANKSTDVALGTSDVAFPTQNAVKTYVDGQITATADDDITSATLSAASLLTINEGTSFVDVSLADLEESADITANATAIQNLQDDVDQNELDADAAIQNLQNDVDQNELDADAAIALKEDAANKSTDITLADATNTLFPTELAVKTYVDGQITATADDDITSATLSAASLLTINEGTSFVDVSLANLEESADIAANTTAIQNVQGDIDQNELDADTAIQNLQNDVNQNELDADAAIQNVQDDVDQNEIDADAAIQNVQDDVDQNELDADAAILTEQTRATNAETNIQNDVDQNETDADAAILLKEDAANKSTDVTLSDATNTLFPTELAVKTYVDNASQHTGAEGSVYFAGAMGAPSEDNDQLFWNNSLNRLGIGTDTPTHKLQVVGQVRATSFANADGTAGSPSYRFNNDSNSGMYSVDPDQLGFSTGGTQAILIDASQNVGIGEFSSGTIEASLHIKSTDVPLKIEPSVTTPTGSSGGQMFVAGDDGILYIFDGTRNKWLSVDRTMIGWGLNSNNTSNRYLRQFNGTDSSNSGWRIVRDGTITGITAQSNIDQTWTLEIRKNDTNGVITSLTMTNVQGNEDGTINIDISKGDFLQAYCNGTSVDYPEALIEIAWRK